jgi:hypothetical protein
MDGFWSLVDLIADDGLQLLDVVLGQHSAAARGFPEASTLGIRGSRAQIRKVIDAHESHA